MRRTILIFFLAICWAGGRAWAQDIGVKTNILYWTTSTPNLGFEFGLGKRTTLDLAGGYNPWTLDREANRKIRHWMVMPEFRYWLCERFNGHFFGLHAHYAEYNAGGINFNADFHRNRYQGHLYGAGLSYGYQWLIGKRWNLEATVGLGYARLWDRKYPIAECGEVIRTRSRNYFGPTKIGLALIFIIK